MGYVSQSGGTGDILSMLVGIYGSKELFVNEYRVMLADKLLANLDFDTDKEVHNLELLKLRFGELSMRQCEIMIKDIDDSKRINSNIRETIVEKKKRRKEDQQKKKRKNTATTGTSRGGRARGGLCHCVAYLLAGLAEGTIQESSPHPIAAG